MIDFIMSNLQGVLMGAAALAIGIYALTGFSRVELSSVDDEPRTGIKYTRSWKRNAIAAAILIGGAATVAVVPKGYVGVIYDANGGIQQEELPEGLHLVVPFKQHVTNVDVRVKDWVFNNENVYVHTQDLHEIRVPFAVNYRINPSEAAHVLQSVAGDPALTILSHAALTSVRTEVGLRKLDQLASDVSAIAEAVADTIRPQAELNGLLVQYVAIEDSVIDNAYITSVRDERISERNIRTAENNAAAAEFKADEMLNLAEGEALAIERLADARQTEQAQLGLSATEYVWYQRWNGMLPTTLLGSDGDFIVDLPATPTPPSTDE